MLPSASRAGLPLLLPRTERWCLAGATLTQGLGLMEGGKEVHMELLP